MFSIHSTSVSRTVARVLLADSDPASRVTLKTLLTTAGYAVDCAGTSGEAVARLDAAEYQLVLADLSREAKDSGNRLIAYAKQKEFRPATALLNSTLSEVTSAARPKQVRKHRVRMSAANVSFLLVRIAELIGERADRRMRRALA